MEYRFKYQIVDEDGNEAVTGSTYIIPESISQFGECESVDLEVASALRHFPIYLRALAIKEEEESRYLDDEGNDVRDLAEKAGATRDAQREDLLGKVMNKDEWQEPLDNLKIT